MLPGPSGRFVHLAQGASIDMLLHVAAAIAQLTFHHDIAAVLQPAFSN